jgi:hypothetical protein
MTIAFKELAGSPIEHHSPSGMTARRQLACAWDDRTALVRELLGDGYEFGASNPAGYPGATALVAARVHVEPLAEDVIEQSLASLTEGLNAYRGFALLTVDYELLSTTEHASLPAVDSATVLTYRTEPAEETLTLPGDDVIWQGNPAATFPSDTTGTLRLPATRHRLTWHRVVSPPWSAIRASTGTLNSAEFLGVAAGKLLFEGAQADRELMNLSELDEPRFGWRIEYLFRENPLVTDATQPGFATSDFAPLLRFDEG